MSLNLDTFPWSFFVQNVEVKCSLKSGRIETHKNAYFFFTSQLENELLEAPALWINDSRINRNCALKNSATLTNVAFHSMIRKGYQSKLFLVHPKGGQWIKQRRYGRRDLFRWNSTTKVGWEDVSKRHFALSVMELSTCRFKFLWGCRPPANMTTGTCWR